MVAVSVSLLPNMIDNELLFSVMPVALTGFTVTAQVAETVPQVAVIVAVPNPVAVTLPFWSTVAIPLLLVLQVTVLSVVLLG